MLHTSDHCGGDVLLALSDAHHTYCTNVYSMYCTLPYAENSQINLICAKPDQILTTSIHE